jgi:glutathione S-transferase
MPGELTLHVCHLGVGGIPPHACRRAHEALRDMGHEHATVVSGRGRPFGLFTTGRRPELRALSGQEKLPVLELGGGATISGSAEIIAWAKATAPAPVA